jgi:hypothetical protein
MSIFQEKSRMFFTDTWCCCFGWAATILSATCGKCSELLKRVAPHVTHVAGLRDSADPTGNGQFDAIQSAILIDAPQALREPLRNLH